VDHENQTNTAESQVFVLIRFWIKKSDCTTCYYQLKIERPYVFTKSEKIDEYNKTTPIVLDKFLAIGPN
jgi:hypothetical protein